METQSRQTASAYINNLLLSRGLLRNGAPVEFAKPEDADGGINATMTQVMNLVHDLVLRRDRESDTLSNLSQNIQTLRTTNTQQSQTIARLEIRNADIDRQLALMNAQERSAQATLRSAETRNRALRAEMARLKGSVAQIRAQCATDLRRRDREITRMKKHLEGRRGRDGTSNQIGVVVVTPGFSRNGQANKNGFIGGETDLNSPDYSLKEETTEFLTQLSQGLSDENDALIGLVRGTLATLRSLQGLPADQGRDAEVGGNCEGTFDENGVIVGPPSYEALATSTDEVLEHLRGLLTNPSFVPLEEVEIREEEIHRLRDGWEMMAERWREAVSLLGGWKKRMTDDGDTINLEDLKVGLKLGSGIPSAQEARQSPFKVTNGIRNSTGSDGLGEMRKEIDEIPFNDPLEETASVIEDIEQPNKGRPLSERDPNSVPAPPTPLHSISAILEENSRYLEVREDDVSLPDFATSGDVQPSPPKIKSRIPQVSECRALATSCYADKVAETSPAFLASTKRSPAARVSAKRSRKRQEERREEDEAATSVKEDRDEEIEGKQKKEHAQPGGAGESHGHRVTRSNMFTPSLPVHSSKLRPLPAKPLEESRLVASRAQDA
ncbi:uncharacterized protein KY384_001493 [Bacidia gigantensis]|uniref:uncharacterized protein n=1 Tax=Bacidia gigantensis TaxID=2732470 RepID=UPI001D04C502|nr:uncharacterized protein KY384_001493 [Bacidia gigantensis]KAG8533752.1 hypothetical protein KY384_001493 [Bacidia gigantensis]